MSETIIPSAVEQLLRRDRAVTLVALLVVSLLAWGYLLAGAGMDMPVLDMAMSMASEWSASFFGLMLAMWAIMMVAMMLPSAAPMILLFTTIERRRRQGSPFQATALFGAAYVLVWFAFAVCATVLQWQFDRFALLSPAMATVSTLFAAASLIAAGVYQFTPLKRACLRGCRSPLEFITQYWSSGPFVMGLRHGLFCLGCCWMLMLLLFVGGVMNVVWVALIAGFVLAEKLAPRGEWLSYGLGALLVSWGSWMLYVHAMS